MAPGTENPPGEYSRKRKKIEHCRMNTKEPQSIPPVTPEGSSPIAANGNWRWAFAMAVVMLVGIVSYLLWHSYQTQSRLQTAAINRLVEDLNSRAKAAEYFIRERENDVNELATSKIVTAYFTNKSLGMSEAYGLKGSLNLIHRQFRHINESTILGGEAIYTRLVLFSLNCEQLVEYQGVSPCPIHRWDWQIISSKTVRQITSLLDRVNPSYLVFIAPVRLSGEIVGYIAGWVSLDVIYRQFIAFEQMPTGHPSRAGTGTIISTGGDNWHATPPIDERLMQSLKRELAMDQAPKKQMQEGFGHPQEALQRPGAYFTLPGGFGRNNTLFVVETRLSLNDIYLVRLIEQTHLVDPHGPIRLLILLALISAALFGIAFVAMRHGAKAQALAVRLTESKRSQKEIRRINEQLKNEILQRKMAESQVTREKNLLRNLIAAIPDIIFYKDIDSAYLGCNPSFEAFCGKKEEHIQHKTAIDIFDRNIAGAFLDQDKDVLNKGEVVQFEQWVDYPDGQHVLLETKKTPYYSETGQMIGLIGISRDITAHKQTELALREQRERLELVIHATNTGVWEWNVETGETVFNERWAAIVGYTVAELSPISIQTWVDLCHSEDLERSNQALARHFSGETEYYHCECRMRHKQGHWVWVYDCGRVVEWSPANKPLRMMGTHSDITQRKQDEEAIRQANETLELRIKERAREIEQLHSQMVMQEKMASVGQLAAGIAHELNNPINFVRTNFATLTENFTDLTKVLEAYRGFVDDYDTRYDTAERVSAIRAKEQSLQIDYLLEDIPALFRESERGFERIARIIQSMRDFSHIDHTGNLTFYNLNKGIEDTLVIAKNLYKYNADVQTDLGDLPEVPCLPEQINQVLLNLVVNGAQAIAENLEGAKGLICIRTWHEGNQVCCRIADNGPGIPSAIRSRIFEPFFTTKAPGKGTGLGLSISYDIIVHKHQGKLVVDCPEIGGTVFTISLPMERQPKATTDEDSR